MDKVAAGVVSGAGALLPPPAHPGLKFGLSVATGVAGEHFDINHALGGKMHMVCESLANDDYNMFKEMGCGLDDDHCVHHFNDWKTPDDWGFDK